MAKCYDCDRPYGHENGFPDLIIPYDAWKRISPTGDDGGLLCPSCICKRLHDAGIRCHGAFMSGPIMSVSEATMQALRQVENIELAIEGRNNRWSGIREMVATPPDAGPGTWRAGQAEEMMMDTIDAACAAQWQAERAGKNPALGSKRTSRVCEPGRGIGAIARAVAIRAWRERRAWGMVRICGSRFNKRVWRSPAAFASYSARYGLPFLRFLRSWG